MKNSKSLFRICLALLSGSIILYSCGGNTNTTPEPTTTSTEENTTTAVPPEENTNTATGPYASGQEVYTKTCKVCHQTTGEGMPNAYPPLAKSDFIASAKKERIIEQVLKGSSGHLVVNGKTFNGTMPPQSLDDQQIADVLNYVLHSWGNNGETIAVEEVTAQRGK